MQSQMVVMGDMSLGGSVTPVESIAECLQVAFDAGAKKVALPMASAADIPSIPPELFTKFQSSFYADPVDAVFKALGVDWFIGLVIVQLKNLEFRQTILIGAFYWVCESICAILQ